jgi:hypothetical protein
VKNAFRHYFPPTEADLKALWANAIFSFDASVLLNIYGYTPTTRDDLIGLLEQHSSRVRIPHQFAYEYSRNRSAVIIKQIHNYLNVEKEFQKIHDTLLAPKRDHPFLSKKRSSQFAQIREELAESRRNMEKLVSSDPFADKLLAIFEGRVGPRPDEKTLQTLQTVARQRYQQKTPPGYADLKEKGETEACGDYIGWQQLMDIATADKTDVILVIDDFKEDWWRIERERMVGPRPELLEEFTQKTRQSIFLYTSENFLRSARFFVNAKINENVIEEVRERLESQKKQLSTSDKVDKPTALAESLKFASTNTGSTELKQKAPEPILPPDLKSSPEKKEISNGG